MAKSVRRIVTAQNKAGKSVILMDGPAPNAVSPPAVPQLVNTVLWITDDSPASNRGDEDASPKGRALGIEPPSRGSVFRIVDFPPNKVFEGSARKMMEEVGGGHALDKGKARHALFQTARLRNRRASTEAMELIILSMQATLRRPFTKLQTFRRVEGICLILC